MTLRLRQMLDRKSVVEEEAEPVHLTVDQIVYIFTSGYLRIERDRVEHFFMYYHCPSECERRSLYPRFAADYLIKAPCLASETIPVSHPGFVLYIIIILVIFVEIITGNTVDDITVDPLAQELDRSWDKVRDLKDLIIIYQYHGFCCQYRSHEQTYIPDRRIVFKIQHRICLCVYAGSFEDLKRFAQFLWSVDVCLDAYTCFFDYSSDLLHHLVFYFVRSRAYQYYQLKVTVAQDLHALQRPLQSPVLVQWCGMIEYTVAFLPFFIAVTAPIGGDHHSLAHFFLLFI